MTKEDTKKMLMYLRTAFPGFLEDMNLTDVVNVWHDAFMNEDVRVVSEATRNYAQSSRYAPTIAGIFEQIKLIKMPASNDDLWALIEKAARNGAYNSAEEFNRLPEECQAFLGSSSALKELAMADMGTMNTIVKGQFMKRVDAIREHREVQRGLPVEVRKAIAESQVMLLQEGY